MKNTQLLIISILLFCNFGFAQTGETKSSKESTKLEFIFSPGVLVQKEIFTEFNIILGEVSDIFPPKFFPVVGVQGYRIGLETNLKSNEDFIIAPKLGYEISITFFSMRLSALNYFQNNKSEFRILPELGASFGGMFNLTYGYGISFNNTISGISNHRLSFSINLNKRLSKANSRLRNH
ncbi:hypothetical protein HNV10_15120 [Winogradskyella litoriviva]|uniref:Outer membrane protein beta-barrel domain-containing protein n=1 Tax=Winogradskyella litoriviva TaxID=1220182 RepID=A0ABX2E7U5_9FLAO|nr:hypothetical protein [Winogradskyella litoriviva]NRD24584.1 hypothetical protein [Winogradskyella litoriviva]